MDKCLSLQVVGSRRCVIKWLDNKWNLPEDSGVSRDAVIEDDHGNIVMGNKADKITAYYGTGTGNNTADISDTYTFTAPQISLSDLNVEHDTTKSGSLTINGITFSWLIKNSNPIFGSDKRELDL